MAVKRRYVIATSDMYPDGTIRPPEELEAAARTMDRVYLTLNHPPKGSIAIPKEQILGTITYEYSKKLGKLLGEAYYYDEFFDRLPKHLQDKVYRHEDMPISPGFGFTMKDDHIITNIVPHHVAVLTDEKPLCPLNKCGVNVRMESDSTMNFRYEQRTEAEDLDAPVKPKKTEPYDPVSLGMVIGELKAEVAQLREQLNKTVQPVQQEPEVATQHEEPDEQPPEPRATEATPRRKILPAGEVRSGDELKTDPITGCIILE